ADGHGPSKYRQEPARLFARHEIRVELQYTPVPDSCVPALPCGDHVALPGTRPALARLRNGVLAMKCCVVLFVWAALLVTDQSAPPQAPDSREEVRFVRELRARHDHDLALEYLERLKKSNPDPELAAELPLETARTLLDSAADEPDSGKRIAVYGQAQA